MNWAIRYRGSARGRLMPRHIVLLAIKIGHRPLRVDARLDSHDLLTDPRAGQAQSGCVQRGLTRRRTDHSVAMRGAEIEPVTDFQRDGGKAHRRAILSMNHFARHGAGIRLNTLLGQQTGACRH